MSVGCVYNVNYSEIIIPTNSKRILTVSPSPMHGILFRLEHIRLADITISSALINPVSGSPCTALTPNPVINVKLNPVMWCYSVNEEESFYMGLTTYST